MTNDKKLILTRDEIKILVDSFYDKVKQDSLIGPIFTVEAKVDWDHHLPKLYDFWEDLLLDSEKYNGRPFPPHFKLELKQEHFERWIKLFLTTVDENFEGLKAHEAKEKALRIASNFMHNLKLMKPHNWEK